MEIVICGGGIIGCAISYYLARRGLTSIIIEEDEIACAASGKAGGLLARTWSEGTECDDLAKLSYNLHMDLAKMYTAIGYRNVNTYSAFVDKEKIEIQKEGSTLLPWVNGNVIKQKLLDSDKNTSQVHPKRLCQQFVHEAQQLTDYKTMVVFDKVIGIEFDNSYILPKVKSVKLESGSIIETETVVIAMGPWSFKALKWFPEKSIPFIKGHRAHSVVLKVPVHTQLPADCLFLEYQTTQGITSPELYTRPDGTVYISGYGDEKELPDKASEVEVEKWRCCKLREIAYAICSDLEISERVAEQACYLPLSPDGLPVIGKISQVTGAYIATGHSCWGILNSTGTGFAMAELIATGECKTLDLKPFAPSRFNENNDESSD